MWAELEKVWGGTVQEEEVTGECWQYMGTQEEGHCFRHRRHPKTQNREYFFVKSLVTDGDIENVWNEDDDDDNNEADNETPF